MRGVVVVILAAALVGCGDRGNRVDFSGDDIGPDLHAIHSVDGEVKMGLTQDWVYFALSDSVRAEATAELRADAEAEGEPGFFGRIMETVVGRALDFRAKYAVREIEDIRWEGGRMRFQFDAPDRRLDDNLQFGEDGSVTEAFAREDVEAFGEAFRAVKRGKSAADAVPSQR